MNFLFFFLIASAMANIPLSDHFDGKRFFNPGQEGQEKTFLQVLKWQLGGDKKSWPEQVPNRTHPAPVFDARSKALVTFINHATFLIQTEGLNFLTDPVFSDRVSPVSFAGPMRVREPGLAVEALPPIHVVLISHNHYDHMDTESLRQIDARFHPLFIVPLGDKEKLLKWGIQNVVELDWWQEQKIKDTTVTFTRAQHWSNRSLWDKYEALWGGYYIRTTKVSLYFGGDTGYGNHFIETKKRLGPPDLSLLPIGAYEPRWFMKFHHMNPEESVKAHLDLESKQSIGMHFGTFQLTDEGYDDPVIELRSAREKMKLSEDIFRILDQGESSSL